MWRSRTFTAVGLATLVAGCGSDGDTKTVTVVQSSPSTQTTATPPPATNAEPLPGGRAAVEGRYLMRVRDTDYEGVNLVARSGPGDESTWPISTTCTQQACRLEVRRELDSGAFENLTLPEVKDRSYATTSTGTTTCVDETVKVPARQRVSIRVSGIAEIDGRPTAQRVDGYLTITAKCDDVPARGIISWRGTRLP